MKHERKRNIHLRGVLKYSSGRPSEPFPMPPAPHSIIHNLPAQVFAKKLHTAHAHHRREADKSSKQAPQTPCDDRRREASTTCTIVTELGPEVQCPLQLHIFSHVSGCGAIDKQGTIRGYCKDRIRVTSLVPVCPGHDDSPPTSVGV